MTSNSQLPDAPVQQCSDVLTVDEAAEMLRVNRKSLYMAVAEGKIPGVVRIGRVIRISRRALESWMQNETG